MRTLSYAVLAFLIVTTTACKKSCTSAEPQQQSVFFENLKDGQQVTSPLLVKFGVKGMAVRPAMEDINDKTSGHHHLLIDSPKGFIEEGQAIPVDDHHIHYGKGQTSGVVELSPGIHTLSLQFADGAHRSYGKKMSATISVTVIAEKPSKEENNAAH